MVWPQPEAGPEGPRSCVSSPAFNSPVTLVMICFRSLFDRHREGELPSEEGSSSPINSKTSGDRHAGRGNGRQLEAALDVMILRHGDSSYLLPGVMPLLKLCCLGHDKAEGPCTQVHRFSLRAQELRKRDSCKSFLFHLGLNGAWAASSKVPLKVLLSSAVQPSPASSPGSCPEEPRRDQVERGSEPKWTK